ncbi:MAG: alpha/beta fold hydrolase [Myxococcota bacterium]|nr:alpha/beta fold hydrolase [Myxococcota bacterium]
MLSRSVPLVLSALVIACSSVEDRRAAPPETTAREAPPAVAAPETIPEPREVRFQASDGVTIAGTLQPGGRADAPLVILVHQLGGSRAEWAPLLERLRERPAVATLAIDLRGHGESTSGPAGATLSWRELDNAQWALTTEDVLAARDFVRSGESGLTPSRVGIVGSSIGSSAAIAAAARSGEDVHAIAALSPGRAYRGFDAITPATQLGERPFLAIVGQEETDSVETARAMARITGGEAVVVDGSAHGLALLRGSPELLGRLETFLRTSLGAEREDG